MTIRFSSTQNRFCDLTDFLEDYNNGKTDPYNKSPFEFTIETNGQLSGGLSGYIGLRWMNIEILAIHPDHRKSGHGEALMNKAIEYALQKNCIGMRLSTVDFQAPDFYKKFGFEVYGTLDNHPKGRKTYAMKKILIKQN